MIFPSLNDVSYSTGKKWSKALFLMMIRIVACNAEKHLSSVNATALRGYSEGKGGKPFVERNRETVGSNRGEFHLGKPDAKRKELRLKEQKKANLLL